MDFFENGKKRCGDVPILSEIIDFFPDPCFAIDLQGRVIAWNKAITELTGIPDSEMIWKGDYAYAVPFYRIKRPILIDLVLAWDEDIARTYKRIIRQGETLIAETENPPFKAQPSYFWNKAQKIYDPNGDCIGAIEVIRDITELKQIELNLKRAEAEKSLILNTTSEIVTYFDLDLRIKWLNSAAAKALGRKEGDLLGRPCYEVWHQRSESCTGCPVVKAKLTGKPQQAEIVTPDGRVWLARGYPVLDQSGNVISLIEFTLEITERKHMEEKLIQTTASLLEAQRIAKIGNWQWCIDSGRVTWSDEIFNIFGLEAQAPSYELAKSLVHPDDLLCWEQSVQNALSARKGNVQIDYRAVRPDGTEVWIHNEALVVRDSNGRVEHIIGTAQDITTRKTIELQLVSQEKKLRRFTALQELVARISTLFANVTAARIKAAIDQTFCDIGRFIDADRSYLFQYSDDYAFVSNTNEWCAGGIRPELPNLQNLSTAPLHWTLDLLRKGQNIAIESVADMPLEAQAEKELLEAQGIRSALLVPVYCEDKLFGFIGFDAVAEHKKWIPEDTLLLRTVSEIVGNAIIRNRNEQELRKSEDWLKMALNAAELGPWEADLASGKLNISPRMAEIFGTDRAGTMSTISEWCALVEKEDQYLVRNTFDSFETWKDGKCCIEFRICRSSDSLMRWIRSEGMICKEDDGRVSRIVGIVADITERKSAQNALQDSEERFRLFMDKSQLVAWIKDEAGRYVYINRCLEERFQMKDANWLEKTGYDLWPLQIADKFAQEDQWVLNSGQSIHFTLESTNSEGRRSCWIGTKFLFSGSSRNRFVAGLAVDITDQKNTEERLKESEERFRTIVKNMPGVVFVHDMDGKIMMVNETAVDHTGFAQHELLDMSVAAIDPYSVRRYDRNHLWKKIKTGTSKTIESIHIRKDGSRYPVEVHLNALELGNQPVILAIAFDISQRKHAEDALRRLNETLEERVAQRSDLAESRAKQLQSLAIELIKAEERERHRISELLHDDLQQILAAAKMQLESIIEMPSGTPMMKDLGQLLEEAISKTRRLSHELSPPVLHQSGLSAALKWLARQMKGQFGLEVDLHAIAELDLSSPIKVFVFRAVKELLFNITKHAGVRKARVELSSTDKDFVITVSDQGKGFDFEVLKPTSAIYGLGLLSIRERVRHIGGDLIIESAPGRGSSFTIIVPVDTKEELKQQTKPEIAYHGPVGFNSIDVDKKGGIRVLFVDDHKVIRQGLIQLAANQAYINVVGEASNGIEAIEKARQLQPGLIIMDVSMPLMDGIEATKKIKAEMPHIRVIGLSMFEDEHVASAMRQAGAEAFIRKTASSAELLKAILRGFKR